MKRILFTALALFTAAARAASLEAPLPAFAAPDAKAPILGTAKAGTKLATVAAPAGWAAVELVGPHTVYVTEKDTLKNFEVRPGGAYHSAPRADSPVVGLAGEKDPSDFVDVAGRFNKFSLKKTLIAYVRMAPTAVTPVAAAPVPAAPAPSPAAAPELMGDLNATLRNDIPANSPASPGHSAQLGEPRLARTFFGVVASTRNPLRPRRPYDFQINDSAGARIAYIDISQLLLTEQIEAFIGRPVFILGTAEPLGSGNEIVIRCETLKLQ
ncbi:MAG: hypothetical protein NTU80_00730 [Verrucomicrobia bacterium]|nr:hypothetical protein [Verrucomicrobiota bacterium]